MKIKKYVFIFMMMLIIGVMLTACGSRNTSEESSTTKTAATGEPSETKEAGDETPEASKEPDTEQNILIAYFSHTGNTEKAAQKIAEYTGGSLAKIQRAKEYEDLQEEAEEEILNGIHPEITISVENIEDYDTIFVGYPIWWKEAPAMIATFLADNDFSEKTIIPFCTSASDEIEGSLHIFNELCPDAIIREGLTANNLDDIEPWLQRLGIIE